MDLNYNFVFFDWKVNVLTVDILIKLCSEIRPDRITVGRYISDTFPLCYVCKLQTIDVIKSVAWYHHITGLWNLIMQKKNIWCDSEHIELLYIE